MQSIVTFFCINQFSKDVFKQRQVRGNYFFKKKIQSIEETTISKKFQSIEETTFSRNFQSVEDTTFSKKFQSVEETTFSKKI